MGQVDTCMAKKILIEHNHNGFCGGIVYGKRGAGKSSYSMMTLHDVYHNGKGIPEDEAWEKVLDHTLFELEDIINTLIEYMPRDVEPSAGIILDDCGVYFSGHIYNERAKEHSILKGMMDTIRSATSSLLMTTPSREELIGYLKNQDDYQIQIIKRNSEYSRKAKIYKKVTLPSGTKRIYKDSETPFNCLLPDWVYEKYQDKRNKYFSDLAYELKEEIEEGRGESLDI
ncbi:MAG: hypothetical protein KGY68_09280 [Candidatus Thermoplasmatota archaeon]|nr:hypothetical protein [Candidatus Thermoplasmatota archaeon]